MIRELCPRKMQCLLVRVTKLSTFVISVQCCSISENSPLHFLLLGCKNILQRSQILHRAAAVLAVKNCSVNNGCKSV